MREEVKLIFASFNVIFFLRWSEKASLEFILKTIGIKFSNEFDIWDGKNFLVTIFLLSMWETVYYYYYDNSIYY